MRSLALACACLALAATIAPMAAAATKVVVFEHDLTFAGAVTPGSAFSIDHNMSYRQVEVRVTGVRGCHEPFDAALVVTTTPPPPIPDSGVFTFTLGCAGAGQASAFVRPGGTPTQGRDYPLFMQWEGVGFATVHVQVLGVPWAFP